MSKEIINAGVLAAMFLLLFVITEFLYHKLKVKAELTRKVAHFGTGIITLLFPVMLNNHWLVLLLCAGFDVILIMSVKHNLLNSINSIERISYGSILYPIAVYGCYLVYEYFGKNLLFFYLPVLTLAICDPVAALFGKRWPYGNFHIGDDRKTVTGSFTFFISSIAASIILFYFLSNKSLNDNLPIILLIAVAGTITEAISIRGIDNITIPASVILVLTLFR